MNETIPGNNSFTGVARTILGVFRETLGFDWELKFPNKTDNDVGLLDEKTGNWTGVLGMLQRDVNFLDIRHKLLFIISHFYNG